MITITLHLPMVDHHLHYIRRFQKKLVLKNMLEFEHSLLACLNSCHVFLANHEPSVMVITIGDSWYWFR